MTPVLDGLIEDITDGRQTSDPSAREVRVDNPATGRPLISLAADDVAAALRAADQASAVAEAWAATSARERSGILMRTFTTMIERRELLADLISAENGKSHADALGEVDYAAEYFRWYAEEAVRIRGEVFDSPNGANRVLVTHEPVGLCLLITPWNFPAAMATRKIGPAIAAGCTAILKPASETPLTALAIADILRESGLPDGVLNVVVTDTAGKVVRALLDDGRVRMLSFTGSTEVGRILLAQASETVIKTAMELGGNAPFLVLDDADVDAALDGALIAKMRNGGQACTAANRFYVADSRHDEFVEGLVERMGAITVGDPAESSTQCGPLINAEAVRKAQELVDDALSRGARLALGGETPDGPGSFYPPTVLVDVPADARILHEEVFGPVAPVVRFTSDDEALAAANDTVHGLVSYLYTGDLARGLRLSARLEAGMVALNRGLVSDPAAPFGGVKQSGLGREGSHEGLHEYLETKYVATTW
ncbi:NAD-dependent succinate-semialdehyde dehydrogenase [Amnibacterium flavum]|uniref:NAD-dependent succinate-semialdehyde dehydrogenase n=1 Tax=Amnibacterium flavum TaxID=2173173 RepID=A0A2V1HPC1_9MICO|nr:NAD-dependent succinate-semialdehyde dehydrogenase [Amnibacterium flavum]PVZ94483.1 NAD-dependent succinate-semialdehyde dehydrogenase [Amnibacterium flavum]